MQFTPRRAGPTRIRAVRSRYCKRADFVPTARSRLKAKRNKRRYQFHFLSSSDYDDFFAGLRDGTLRGWASTLQAALGA
ncbi:MAG: hypothetical protein ABSG43_31600 [Solirubrobacteraceae bacterium]